MNVLEQFFYNGKHYIKYADGSCNTITKQQYKDAKQFKQQRINLGWTKDKIKYYD